MSNCSRPGSNDANIVDKKLEQFVEVLQVLELFGVTWVIMLV
jgi:hypothetical protein